MRSQKCRWSDPQLAGPSRSQMGQAQRKRRSIGLLRPEGTRRPLEGLVVRQRMDGEFLRQRAQINICT